MLVAAVRIEIEVIAHDFPRRVNVARTVQREAKAIRSAAIAEIDGEDVRTRWAQLRDIGVDLISGIRA